MKKPNRLHGIRLILYNKLIELNYSGYLSLIVSIIDVGSFLSTALFINFRLNVTSVLSLRTLFLLNFTIVNLGQC